MDTHQKLYRSSENKVIGGVAAGMGKRFDVDITLMRVIFVILALFSGVFPGIAAYIIAMIIIPSDKKTEGKYEINNERVKEAADELRATARKGSGHGRNIVGLILIVIGLSILFDGAIPIFNFIGKVFWPLVIIIIGIYLLKGGRHRGTRSETPEQHHGATNESGTTAQRD